MRLKFFIFLVLLINSNVFGDKQITGLIPIDKKGNDIFYWLHLSQNKPDKDPLVLWFTGGPGASSVSACLTYLCPFIYKDKKLVGNKFNWNKNSNLLIIDQPIGAGFSKGDKEDIPNNSFESGEHLVIFLKRFYEKYPEFKFRKLYVTGQSYGGHYVPIYASLIFNSKIDYFNLKGILMINGFYDLNNQLNGYVEYGKEKNLFHPLQLNFMKIIIFLIKNLQKINIIEFPFYLLKKFIFFPVPYFREPFNVYDIRTNNAISNEVLEEFVNQEKVLEALNIKGRNWHVSNKFIFDKFIKDFFYDTTHEIHELLSNNINVYMLNGLEDYICNYIGNREVNLKIEKYIKNSGINKNLFKYFEVENCGHSVAEGNPEEAFKILNQFINEN